MKPTRHGLVASSVLTTLLILFVSLSACGQERGAPYTETFETIGNWGTGRSTQVEGQVRNNAYELYVKSNHGLFLASAGKKFGDGIYQIEATQLEGPLNNGYGLVFKLDEEKDAFYTFEISGDGYIWIGYCEGLCEDTAIALVGGDWYPSPAVLTGRHATNRLQVIVERPLMTFLVNGVEIGRTSDTRLAEGDIGVMVEALGEGNIRVAFDNFEFSPRLPD